MSSQDEVQDTKQRADLSISADDQDTDSKQVVTDHELSNVEPEQFPNDPSEPEFIEAEPQNSGCCGCFKRRRYAPIPTSSAELSTDEEYRGLSAVGNSLRQNNPLREVGQGFNDMAGSTGLRAVGDGLRRTPLRAVGKGLVKSGPMRSAGLGLRKVVGLGKPKTLDDLTEEQQRQLLLRCGGKLPSGVDDY